MSSKSSSKSSSTTQQYDNRVAASDEALALGAGAAIVIDQPFSAEVGAAYADLVGLVRDQNDTTFNYLGKVSDLEASQYQNLLEQLDRTQKGGSTIYTDIFPYVAIVAAVLIFVYIIKAVKK